MLCYTLDIDVYPVDRIILILQTTESSLNILHTVLITFPMVWTKKVCLTIKSFCSC